MSFSTSSAQAITWVLDSSPSAQSLVSAIWLLDVVGAFMLTSSPSATTEEKAVIATATFSVLRNVL